MPQNEIRWLGYITGEEVRNDYTILVMAFISLVLLLITELIRRGLDRLVHGRKFAETTVEVVYRELTSLGIVSAALFIIHKYSVKPMNETAVQVFEDIHYVLFFVALINAIQCSILYYLTLRVVHKDWVQVEHIDIDHYVAIRQQFIRVNKRLQELEDRWNVKPAISSSTTDILRNGLITTFMENIYELLHHPRLLLKYRRLYVQIRFHELRVQLIHSNKLPPKFKVSEYLRESLNHVFMSFIDISSVAWLSLLGVVNLLYFLCGVLTFSSSSLRTAGSMLGIIFIFHPFVFIIITFVIFWKIKRIFNFILLNPINRADGVFQRCGCGTADDDSHMKHQRGLFWAGQPILVIAAAQYMLFGFATCFSIWFIYKFDDLKDFTDLPRPNVLFITFCVVGSVLFIILWSHIVPAYTLCTGLGALVDKDRLQESCARFELESFRKERIALNIKAEEEGKLRIKRLRRTEKWRMKSFASSFQLEHITDLVHTTNDDLEIERQKLKLDSSTLRKSASSGVDEMRKQLSEHSKINAHRSLSDSFASMRLNSVGQSVISPGNYQSDVYSPNNSSRSIVSMSIRKETTLYNRHLSTESFRDKVKKIMDSTAYYILNGFFATTIAFFAVGMRIELFLISYCILPDGKLSWKPSLQGAFWLEVAMLIYFLLEGLIGLIVYARTKESRTYVIAWVFDLVVASVCIIILMISESQRCCSCNHRDLGENLSATATCDIPSYLLCCPSFGKRLCGGLGNLEPFTALIALRAISWLIFRPILHRSSHSGKNWSSNTIVYDSDAHKFSLSEGKMIDLWKKAVITFPDIVERHGKFSSELLQAMLDIPPIFEGESKQSGSSYETKHVIKESSSAPNRSVRLDNAISVQEADSPGNRTESWVPIIEPSASLIRVMRRCEQKLLPLLDEWVVADIILTENELIWFEVMASDSSADVSDLMLSRSYGGHGMRVSDVSNGRSVAGRLSLTDIRAIHIEHHTPNPKPSEITDNRAIRETGKIDQNFQKECWEEASPHESFVLPTAERWARVAYESLSIQSTEGTLQLRFLVDLRDGEVSLSKTVSSQDDESYDVVNMRTNEASLWCDAISKKIGKAPTESTSGGVISQFRKTLSMAVAARSFR